MRVPRAFTLLELMVASTMSLIVLAAGISSVGILIRTLNRTGQASSIVTEVQLLSEFLVAQLQGVGGGAVRPWMVLVVDNNGGLDDSDVIRFADVPATVPSSATLMASLGNGAFSLFVPDLSRGADGGRCLLTDLRKDTDHDGLPEATANTAAAYAALDLSDHEAILVSPSGDTWRSVVVESVGLEPSFAGCFVRFASSSSGLAATGQLTAADRITQLGGSENLEQWVGGQVAFVRFREWRLVPASAGQSGRLVERLRTRGPVVERTLFEGVLDLQIALGYDFDPFDGSLREHRDTRGDEWINSSDADDRRVARIPAELEQADLDPLLVRMLEVGVVIALPRAERMVEVKAFDGRTRSGPEARVVGGRAYLRNLLLFL
jgi:prepilin-type N-terminal cleavage/methylation domain-containing protein